MAEAANGSEALPWPGNGGPKSLMDVNMLVMDGIKGDPGGSGGLPDTISNRLVRSDYRPRRP